MLALSGCLPQPCLLVAGLLHQDHVRNASKQLTRFHMFNRTLVGSNPNMMLTQQTWGQRLRRVKVAWSKRRALAFYFSMRIWYMFQMSKCRGEWDVAWSVHLAGTCRKNAVAQWRLLTNFAAKRVFKSEVATAQPLIFNFFASNWKVYRIPKNLFVKTKTISMKRFVH